VVVGDAAAAHQLAEALAVQEVALDRILQVGLPVEADRPRDVGLLVEGRVLVDLDDADVLVFEVVLHPLGINEYVLGVVRHLPHLQGKGMKVFGDYVISSRPRWRGAIGALCRMSIRPLRDSAYRSIDSG
jgi:hypothetical protein